MIPEVQNKRKKFNKVESQENSLKINYFKKEIEKAENSEFYTIEESKKIIASLRE